MPTTTKKYDLNYKMGVEYLGINNKVLLEKV